MWTLTPADAVGLSGQSITASQGTSSIQVDYVDTPDGLSFTAYQGSVSVNNGADMTVGLASQSFSGSVGAISPADVVGLTGVEFSAYVGELYPVYFKDVDIESSAGYEDVDIEGSTTYTDVNIAA